MPRRPAPMPSPRAAGVVLTGCVIAFAVAIFGVISTTIDWSGDVELMLSGDLALAVLAGCSGAVIGVTAAVIWRHGGL